MAEWLRRGLQILLSQFDSGRGLQKSKKTQMIDKIIFKIASNTENFGFLDNYTHTSSLKNSTCGDSIKIYLLIEEDKIIKFQ